MFENLTSGENLLRLWFYGFLAVGLIAGIASGFFKARKIQPSGFRWKIFGHEIGFGAINVFISGFTIGPATAWLTLNGWITFNEAPVEWWVIALEYVLYFFLFDTWFYWLHRWMHREPVYTLIHKLHHHSTSPNLMTTLSVNPLESIINGGFVPLFLTVFVVHPESMALILPTNIIMGLYVHSGYEFFPRWWNKSWTTKWFITATFHDQHHHYFVHNFGGYTTIWDRLCGTMRPKFEADYANPKAKRGRAPEAGQTETA
ncbi:MAG: sterol desaturase family protein [Novosphingobium sp.]|nr:sterol desaturase family protein [Novosphingobium sp.]